MRVILLGQPELKQAVTSIPQLAQRVKLFFHLEGLTLKETAEYIDYRLLVSGHGGNTLFDQDTVGEIHKLSRGIPRLINKLCDGMMMCAYAEDRPFIDPHDLKSIRKDLLGDDGGKAAPATVTPGQGTATIPSNMDAPVEGFGDLSKILQRIASALENIDGRLARAFPENGVKPAESASSVTNIKPLNPTRK